MVKLDLTCNINNYQFLLIIPINVIVFLIELFLVGALFEYNISLAAALIYHVLIVLILIILCIYNKYQNQNYRFYLLLTILTFITSAFGSFISLLSCSIYFFYLYRNKLSEPTWLYELDPITIETASVKLYKRLNSNWEDFSKKSTLVPIQDIISSGSIEQKRMALAKISRHFSRSFSTILKQATRDPENCIRVQAATTIANIEQKFSTELITLEKKISKNQQNQELLYKLAKHADDYAYSGILDADQYQQLFYKAIDYYQRYAKISMDMSTNFALNLGRLYLRTSQYDIALLYLRYALEDPTEITRPTAFMWYIEVLYQQKKYEQIKTFCRQNYYHIDGYCENIIRAYEMIELWVLGYDQKNNI